MRRGLRVPPIRDRDALAPALGVHAGPSGIGRSTRADTAAVGNSRPSSARSSSLSGSGQDNPAVLARRMYSPTVEGEAWMERAMARIDSPASKNSRSTRWILRMDNLLKAIDISSLKGTR